jgi:putative glutamine amidotransferase
VNSFHHQAVDALGRGLRVVARAADGTIEAVEGLGTRFVLGVQWHAEGLVAAPRHRALFEALVVAAGAEGAALRAA